MKKTLSIFIVFLSVSLTVNAQTFGFGCLGLSGFYGGYGIHTYEATGLNSNLETLFNSLSINQEPLKFEKATGFRFGANILRANFDHVFLTAKGFFQFAKESKDFEYASGSDQNRFEYELSTNHWGIGIDFGIPVFSFLDLKIVEGGVTIYNVDFNEKMFLNDEEISSSTYEIDDTKFGYYVGTGLIINLIEGYVSLEGSALYHFYEINELSNRDGDLIPSSSIDEPFIEKGGFAAAVQLNIGFPL